MNKLLEKAFAEAALLPDEDQEAIAGHILAEIEDERGRMWQTQGQTSRRPRAAELHNLQTS